MSIEVRHLRKTFGAFKAVRDLSFEVPTGSLFAFLGANGAGESTTIGCITTVLRPTSGTIHVADRDAVKDPYGVRAIIGAVFQQSLLDPLLSVRENLAIRAGFYGLHRRDASARIDELAEVVGLQDFLDRRYGVLSGGQKRRADIARAIVHRPSVIFLDEPTAGLDPQSREQIWSAIGQLRADHSTTVFLTTHYMEETERADQVCIISEGQILAHGTPAELRSSFSRSVLTVRASEVSTFLAACEARGVVGEHIGDVVRVSVDQVEQARELVHMPQVTDFEFRHGTMDDVFLNVTGGRAA